MCTNLTQRGGLFNTVQQPLLMLIHLEWKVPWNLLKWLVSSLNAEFTFQFERGLFFNTVGSIVISPYP